MEDAILGNSTGATYKSFILDVEIVIKKEGTANIAEGRVKNRNTKENNNNSREKGQRSAPEKNKKQDVYLVNANQTNIREIDSQPRKNDFSLFEKNNSLSTKNSLYISRQNCSIIENDTSEKNRSNMCKDFTPQETNSIEITNKKNHSKKREKILRCFSNITISGIEPIDISESNKIFMSNVLQLSRQNSDSALYCKATKTLSNILRQELDAQDIQYESGVSVGELSRLRRNRTFWNHDFKKSFCNMFSCGDFDVTTNSSTLHQAHFEKLYLIKNCFMNKMNILNINLLRNYLKENVLKKQEIEQNNVELLANINIELKSDHPNVLLPTLKEITSSKDNVVAELKNVKDTYVNDSEHTMVSMKCEEPQRNSNKDSTNSELEYYEVEKKSYPNYYQQNSKFEKGGTKIF